MELVDIVTKLTGPIEPVGDTHIDGKRLDNLVALRDLTRELLDRIEAVADTSGGHMASVKAAKDCASAFLRDVRGVTPSQVPSKSLNAMAADLLRPYLKPGQKVIWREAFRWHDDNGVLSNHYDGMELPALAEDFGYDWYHAFDFKHAAIVWKKGAASGVLGTFNDQGENHG